MQLLSPLLERLYTEVHWIRRPGKNPVCVRKPIGPNEIKSHLNCVGPAIGAVPITPGTSTTRVAVLDLDSHKGETDWAAMQLGAFAIIDAAELEGLRANPFRSTGGQGMHLIFLWDAPQDAYSVRERLAALLTSVGLSVGTEGLAAGQVEVFPKQSEVELDSLGSMFILPLAGASCALDVISLDDAPREELAWRVSDPVPALERPAKSLTVLPEAVPFELVAAAVAAIPNCGPDELVYDEWFRLVAAIHHATGGSEEGRGLAHDLSAKSSKYDGNFLDRNTWPHLKLKDDGITVQSLFAAARMHGFNGDIVAAFDDLGPLPVVTIGEGDRPNLDFATDDNGRPLATIGNVHLALSRADYCGLEVAFDNFRDELMVTAAGRGEWRAFKDVDYARVRLLFDSLGFKPVSDEIARAAVNVIAAEREFDSATLWLEQEVPAWDGVGRVDCFYSEYLNTVDTPYTRAIGSYMWTAMAGRVLVPGIKADMAPIWVGKQGTGKTTGVAALVVSPSHFAELKFDSDDEKQARLTRGVLVAELSELRGLHTRDHESIKSWISRTHEKWVPKYREFATEYPRRFLAIGTSNSDEFLGDETGNRRWLPVNVGDIDVTAIERDRLQLWAEARDRFRSIGVGYQGIGELATEAHEQFRIRDAWEDMILPYINAVDPSDPAARTRSEIGLTTLDVLTEALAHDATKIGRPQEMRVARILKFAGLSRLVLWENGKASRRWRKEL